MRIASLGSGSKGNATLIECDGQVFMIDCGFNLGETERRLARLGLDGSNITAVLVTHEHSDHISGVGVFARKFNTPVFMSRGSARAERCGTIRALNFVRSEQPVSFGRIGAFPFSVPHDAREPIQWAIDDGKTRFSLITDLGHPTPFVSEQMGRCDAIMLECNHDQQMLRDGPYPAALKRRVGGDYGHLNNDQSAQLLTMLDRSKLHTVIAAHLSEENNRAELAQNALSSVMGWESQRILVADPRLGLEWFSIGMSDRSEIVSGETHAKAARVV